LKGDGFKLKFNSSERFHESWDESFQ